MTTQGCYVIKMYHISIFVTSCGDGSSKVLKRSTIMNIQV